MATPTLQGALKNGFGEAVVACEIGRRISCQNYPFSVLVFSEFREHGSSSAKQRLTKRRSALRFQNGVKKKKKSRGENPVQNSALLWSYCGKDKEKQLRALLFL